VQHVNLNVAEVISEPHYILTEDRKGYQVRVDVQFPGSEGGQGSAYCMNYIPVRHELVLVATIIDDDSNIIDRIILQRLTPTIYEKIPDGASQTENIVTLKDGSVKLSSLVSEILLSKEGFIGISGLSLLFSILGRTTTTIDGNIIKTVLQNNAGTSCTIEYDVQDGTLTFKHPAVDVILDNKSAKIQFKVPVEIINKNGDLILDVENPTCHIKLGKNAISPVRTAQNTATCSIGVPLPPVPQSKVWSE